MKKYRDKCSYCDDDCEDMACFECIYFESWLEE